MSTADIPAQRGRDHRFGSPAVPLGEGDRLVAMPPGSLERMGLRHGSELREAADFEVGSADLPGQDGALLQVAFSILLRQGPRLDSPQIHQRRCSQVAAECDVLVGLPGNRGGEESGLFDNVGEVSAPPRQPQLHRCGCHAEAALAIRGRRLGVRLGDC